jgi:hypothetical protein
LVIFILNSVIKAKLKTSKNEEWTQKAIT